MSSDFQSNEQPPVTRKSVSWKPELQQQMIANIDALGFPLTALVYDLVLALDAGDTPAPSLVAFLAAEKLNLLVGTVHDNNEVTDMILTDAGFGVALVIRNRRNAEAERIALETGTVESLDRPDGSGGTSFWRNLLSGTLGRRK